MAKTNPHHSKFPKPMISKGSFISLGKIDSTNNYAMWTVRSDMAEHGMTWYARNQTSGKGQHGKKWESAPGENITMTMALEPGDLFQIGRAHV